MLIDQHPISDGGIIIRECYNFLNLEMPNPKDNKD